MISNGLKERFLMYKKVVLILIAIILFLTIGLILTIAFMDDSLGRFYLICIEAIFIYVFVLGIYILLSKKVARKVNEREVKFHLSKEEIEKFRQEAKEMDKFAK